MAGSPLPANGVETPTVFESSAGTLILEKVFESGLEDEAAVPVDRELSESVSASPLAVADEEPVRVDDLLRQFRERYGRGSL